ncbi:hypothetical protein IOK49_04040 [Fervidicoccus fontis]|uniref:CopG family transcriptional regulator n=2 Tax=Fervidicoccus fontis TaxID=683846 RepID=I0A0Z0_FERFK|nr:hypothetical protein [Fervidicoccus fontis]AFH42647.1 hypothetical protein FFONT_0657 [Fervidicoccus fontis Kam940]MBE9391244.1 hypothetical protein [Fervidicoccus fontis]
MSYETVSAKIPKRLKELMDKYGIKPGPVIRKAIEEEVKKYVLKEVEKELSEISQELSAIQDDEIARLIREDREGH